MTIRQVSAHGLARDAAGRMLLAGDVLPGGLLRHGEPPADAVTRAFHEQTGLSVRTTSVHAGTADISADGRVHTDRILFDVEPTGGDLLPVATWQDRADLPFGPLPPPPATVSPQFQRFSAYALATDPAGRILLTRIAPGYPSAGRWHLPGGGTDPGETPEQGLARELVEETSQAGRIVGLMGVSDRHNPAAVGPEGVPMDWHVVRVLYRVQVDSPVDAVVSEAAGGSTDSVAWFEPAEAARLPLTEIARKAVAETVGDVIS